MKTIRDFNVLEKVVIIRCDFNVPLEDNIILDDTKIKESLESITYLINNGAKVVILSHLGKIKEEADKINNSLYPVSLRLSQLLNKQVIFSNETRGDKLTNLVNNLKKGEILLVENTRYEDIPDKKESSCDLDLAKYWASLGDIFINDAYGTCHRSHASNTGIPKFLPSGIGFLIEKEINKLKEIMNENTHPFILIMGGKKVNDKIKLIESLIEKCDKLLIGGGMAFTFLKAQGYNVGKSIVDINSIDFCKNILNTHPNKIILPLDIVASTSLEDNNIKTKDISKINEDDIGFDIGSKTIELFTNKINGAKRVIINGTMGIYENKNYEEGTKKIYYYLAKEKIKTLVGGGDSVASVNKLGFGDKFFHLSTGGGATLEFLEGKELPGLSAIKNE